MHTSKFNIKNDTLFIRKFTTILSILFVSAISFTSCKGSAGKKAATETLEFIERKAASKAASSVEREAGQVERALEENADDAYRSTRSSRPSRPRHHSSYDDGDNDYEDTQSQAYYATCPYCNGGGIIYATDMYGNVLVDYYGNPQTITCGNCGGSGQVIVYQ